MPPQPTRWYGAEFDRIERGELPSIVGRRLEELTGWGGSSSFLTPGALAAGYQAGIQPLAQVVGLSTGVILRGYVRTTHSGQGRLRPGVARWREYTGPVKSWGLLRRRALDRLTKQAQTLDADAVVGVRPWHRLDSEAWEAEVGFAGTAVRVDAWRARKSLPVLTLASPQELWLMLRSGVEPTGIATAFAQVETLPSIQTASSVVFSRRRMPNTELTDLTKSVYEVRRLALARLASDAQRLNADGLIGIQLNLARVASGRQLALLLTAHVLASAIRRVEPARMTPSPVLNLTTPRHG